MDMNTSKLEAIATDLISSYQNGEDVRFEVLNDPVSRKTGVLMRDDQGDGNKRHTFGLTELMPIGRDLDIPKGRTSDSIVFLTEKMNNLVRRQGFDDPEEVVETLTDLLAQD